MKNKNLILFVMGGLGYGLIEILWRGNTHWSMMLTGGLCLLLLYQINLGLGNTPFIAKCAFGAFTITGIEFIVGYFVNIVFLLDVWDYADVPFNYLGQVCLLYTFLWFLLCIPVFLVCIKLQNYFGDTQQSPHCTQIIE